jgi:gliding motility-associated-like protein
VREVVCEEPEIFIPTAFSPNNDQRNDVFYVRGNTIESMQLVVYDRWGEKVFESNSPGQGWDGTFRGKPLPPDVYAYYLTAICFNRSTFLKKGNITLLR